MKKTTSNPRITVHPTDMALAKQVKERHLMSDDWMRDVIRGLSESVSTAAIVRHHLKQALK